MCIRDSYYSPRPAVPVVVYAHSLPLYSSNPKGYITISYAMRELRRDAAAILSDNSYQDVYKRQLLNIPVHDP